MQRIDYAVYPGVQDPLLMATTTKILGHIFRSKPSFKDFREWMRDEGLWNKEEIPKVMELLGVSLKPQPTLGPWASAFLDAPNPEAQQDQLFQLLLDNNTLLVKYVFEALDMEGGGRLHSTHELHRMLSSYVYPGEPIRLDDFKAWIKWAVLSGRIKLIGIRWGLTDAGKAIVPRLRMIDVEEFLEDEAEEHLTGPETVQTAAEAEQTSPPPSSPPIAEVEAPAAPQKAPKKSPKAAAKAEAPPEGGEEDLPDMPDEPATPPPVDEAAALAYEAQLAALVEAEEPAAEGAPQPPPAAARAAESQLTPSGRRSTLSPIRAYQQSQRSHPCESAPLELPDVITALRDHGRAEGLGGGSLRLACGLEARMYKNEAPRFLFLAGLLARLFGAAPDGRLAEIVVEAAGGLGPLAVLLERPEAAAEVVVRWGLAMPDADHSAARAAVFDAVMGGRALASKASLPTVLAEAPRSEVLVAELQRGLLKGAPAMSVFWLIREMVRLELWKHEAAKSVASVPSRANRLFAYRLRLIDSHFAHSTAKLIEVARRLTSVLPPGSVEALAFEMLAPDDHLRFDCHKVVVCQSPCGLSSAR